MALGLLGVTVARSADPGGARPLSGSPVDPRLALLTALAFVVLVSWTPSDGGLRLPWYLASVLLVAFAARVPLGFVLARASLVLPFAGMVALTRAFGGTGEVLVQVSLGWWTPALRADGLAAAVILAARAFVAASGLALLAGLVPFPRLLAGLQGLGLPRILVATLSFTYRYTFVLLDEAKRMATAVAARGTTHPWRIGGRLLGLLLVRAYGRAERIFWAMQARGYDGTHRVLGLSDAHWRGWPWALCLVVVWLVIGLV